MPDRMSDMIECQSICQIECQKECQNTCQKVCQNRCQIESQIECQSICQKERQIECQNKYAIIYIYIFPDGMSETVSGWGSREERNQLLGCGDNFPIIFTLNPLNPMIFWGPSSDPPTLVCRRPRALQTERRGYLVSAKSTSGCAGY